MSFTIILARDSKGGIGKDNDLPWKLPADMKHFQNATKGGVVIMGRKTWESIPHKRRPLPGRVNVVLTRNLDYELPEGVHKYLGVDQALAGIARDYSGRPVFVIGGAGVLQEAIKHPDCERLILTEVDGDFECDTFFPEFTEQEFRVLTRGEEVEEAGVTFRFCEYVRVKALT